MSTPSRPSGSDTLIQRARPATVGLTLAKHAPVFAVAFLPRPSGRSRKTPCPSARHRWPPWPEVPRVSETPASFSFRYLISKLTCDSMPLFVWLRFAL